MAFRRHLFQGDETPPFMLQIYALREATWLDLGEAEVQGYLFTDDDVSKIVIRDRVTKATIFETKIQSPVEFQKQNGMLFWRGDDTEIDCENRYDITSVDRLILAFDVPRDSLVMSDFILYSIFTDEDSQDVTFYDENPANNSLTGMREPVPVEELIVMPPLPTADNLDEIFEIVTDLGKSRLGRDFLVIYLWQHVFVFKIRDIQEAHPSEKMNELLRLMFALYVSICNNENIEEMMQGEVFYQTIRMLEPSYDFADEMQLLEEIDIDNEFLQLLKKSICLYLFEEKILPFRNKFNFVAARTFKQATIVEMMRLITMNNDLFKDLLDIFRKPTVKFLKAHLIIEMVKLSTEFLGLECSSFLRYVLNNGFFEVCEYSIENYDQKRDLRTLVIETLGAIREVEPAIIRMCEANVITYLVDILNSDRDCQLNQSGRAVQLHVLEYLKKILIESKDTVINGFFTYFAEILTNQNPDTPEITAAKMPMFLEIAILALYVDSELTLNLISTHQMWLEINSKISKNYTTSDKHSVSLCQASIIRSIISFLVKIASKPVDSMNYHVTELLASNLVRTVLERIYHTRENCRAEEQSLSLIFLDNIAKHSKSSHPPTDDAEDLEFLTRGRPRSISQVGLASDLSSPSANPPQIFGGSLKLINSPVKPQINFRNSLISSDCLNRPSANLADPLGEESVDTEFQLGYKIIADFLLEEFTDEGLELCETYPDLKPLFAGHELYSRKRARSAGSVDTPRKIKTAN